MSYANQPDMHFAATLRKRSGFQPELEPLALLASNRTILKDNSPHSTITG
jgi:hypothetical protein